MSPWEQLLAQPHSGGHFVQLYESDEEALARNVCRYAWEGLRRGEGMLFVVTPDHRELFSRCLDRLGADLPGLLANRQLLFLDAQQTMAEFMVNGHPDWLRFEKTLRAAIRFVRPTDSAQGLRAYGEMVGILWKARQFAAAVRLEQFWNRLLEQAEFSLYCAYAIDIFGKDFEIASLDEVLCTHSHLVPSQSNGTLETAISRAMDEVLGPEAEALRIVIKTNHKPSRAVMPMAESMVLWLRKNLPDRADEIVTRARRHYESLSQTAVLSNGATAP
jgi:hypothetical protein